MNREIRFRAWDEQTSKFIEPDGINIYWNCTAGILTAHIEEEKTTDWRELTLSQYTGLKSKIGQDIYESDICTKMISPDENNLAPKELYRGLIVYHYGGFCLHVGDYYYPLSWQHGVIEIIGNIFEHPSLLNPQII